MMMQNTRNNRNSARRRISISNASGGAALEPIYENEHSHTLSHSYSLSDNDNYDPLREYMSRTIMNHIDNSAEIVADNAPTHPEFIVKKIAPSKLHNTDLMMADNRWEDSNNNKKTNKSSLQKQQRSKSRKSSTSPPPSEGRWGSRDFPTSIKKRVNFSNDSNSSINTASTSSLSLLYDDDDNSVESFTETTETILTARDIIDRASDVVAGKYDCSSNSDIIFNLRTGGRRQARRSSMPSSLDLPPTLPSCRSTNLTDSTHSETPSCDYFIPLESKSSVSSSVALDKYGVPIRPSTSGTKKSRRRRERRSSMPSRPDPDSSSYDVKPLSVSINYNSSHSTQSASVAEDKCGIPIPRPTSKKIHTSRRRRERRSSMPSRSDMCSRDGQPRSRQSTSLNNDSSYSSQSAPAAVDKFGIPIPQPTSSIKSTRRRRDRRSSMPNYMPSPVEPSISKSAPLDKFGIPIRSALSPDSSFDKDEQESRGPNRSVSFDLPPLHSPLKKVNKDVPVDKYGIPTRAMESPGRRRQQRRSSLPTSSVSADQRDPVDTAGPLASSTPFSSIRRRGRRSSLTSASMNYTYTPPVESNGNGPWKASETRFLSEELQIPSRNSSTTGDKKKKTKNIVVKQEAPMNGAPIRPVRVRSIECFGSKGKKAAVLETKKHNASFDMTPPSMARNDLKKPVGKPFDSTINGKTGAPMRPTRVPSVDAFGSNTNSDTLNQIVTGGCSNAQWGDADGSVVSSNSLMQQDGKWWLL